MAEKRNLKQAVVQSCSKVKAKAKEAKASLANLPVDDKAIISLALGVGSWGLMTGVGTRGALGMASLVSGVGAVAFGMKGKASEKEPLQRASLWGTALGTLSVTTWLVLRREGV